MKSMKEITKYLITFGTGIALLVIGAIFEPIIYYIVFPQGVEHFMETYGSVIRSILIILGAVIIVALLAALISTQRGKKDRFFLFEMSSPPMSPDYRKIDYPKYGVVWPISYRLDPFIGNHIYVARPQCPKCMRELRHEKKGKILKKDVLRCRSCGAEYPVTERLAEMKDDVREEFRAELRRKGILK